MAISSQITRGISRHFRKVDMATERAQVNALNRAGKSAYGATIKFLAGNYNISQKNLKKYFSYGKANRGKKRFKIIAQRKSISFFVEGGSKKLFGARQLKKGLKFTVRKGKPQLIKSGFIAEMKSGHKGGYIRKGKERFPIKELYGLNVGDVFFGDLTQDALEAKFFERFEIELKQQLQYQMSKI